MEVLKMKIFKLDDVFSIVCETKDTRNGFCHIAVLLCNGNEREKAKCNYLNRTWEYFTYETVILKLVDACFSETESKKYREIVKTFARM